MNKLPFLMLALTTLAAASGEAFHGRWLTADMDAVIEVSPCGNALCGVIVGIKPHLQNGQPDPDCGLRLLHLTKWNAERKRWEGKVLDPDSKKQYSATLDVKSSSALELRAAWGLLTFKENWTRFTGTIGSHCEVK